MRFGGILVKSSIRREGIGTVLLEKCKKEYHQLKVIVPSKNKIAITFFEKNGFEVTNINQNNENEEYILEWKEGKESKIKLIYFDEDIDSEYLKNNFKGAYQNIDVKKIIKEAQIENLEVYSIKSYMKFRKKIEEIMNLKKILLYIDYNNYYKYLDDQIKEIAKIKQIELKVLVCEPFSIENAKKGTAIKQIEDSYKNYDIIKIDCSFENTDKNITLNQIFYKRMEILVKKIQDIAENI